ncbi:MAG TPA: L-aspartate oxidase [Thermoanaerobaculia bacterium]|nr:L-aspartate oxidase [Thermoanaerobaculia bacterium]
MTRTAPSPGRPAPRAGGGAGLPAAYDEISRSDVLVLGAGAAGLSAALGCAPLAVSVLTKARLGPHGGGGASAWAQGGVASALGDDDTPALHAADTLAAGAGLNDPAIVELLAGEGPRQMRALVALGARFDRDASGRLALGREAAHSRRRILHAHGDSTGAEIVRALLAAVRRAPAIQLVDETFALDLVLAGAPLAGASPRVLGVLALHSGGGPGGGPGGRRVLHLARAVVLATGGLGQLFLHTTNPREATGDGLAMAARAGARLADLEFVQFHPTALAGVAADGEPLPLLTEALRGEGAVLIDDRGTRFMSDEHPDRELAPRDVVARAIWRRLAAGRQVFLDARAAVGERFPERFPTVYALCRQRGLDPRREPLPVAPAAHYHMGGVAVDANGRTSLPGLWACGEVAATGAHGANRLASNSLLEALVFGARVAADLCGGEPASGGGEPWVAGDGEELWTVAEREPGTGAGREPRPGPGHGAAVLEAWEAWEAGEAGEASGASAAGAGRPEGGAAVTEPAPAELALAVRRLMWERVGLVRDAGGLRSALRDLDRLAARCRGARADRGRGQDGASAVAFGEARNLLAAGRLVAAAALARRESRGGHFRSDYPAPDPSWRRRQFVTAAADGSALCEDAGADAPAILAAGGPIAAAAPAACQPPAAAAAGSPSA